MEEATQTPAEPASDALLTWQATSHHVHERGRQWYMIGSAVLLMGIVYAVWSGSWALIIVLVLCGLMYFMLRNHIPATKTVVVTRDGLKIDNTFDRWDEFSGFWIVETPINSELRVEPKNKKKNVIVMQLAGTQPELVRQVMGPLLEEMKEKKETLIDKFIRICKL